MWDCTSPSASKAKHEWFYDCHYTVGLKKKRNFSIILPADLIWWMGLAAQGFCNREGKSVIHDSGVVTGHDKHPEVAVFGARVIRWHSLVRAAAPLRLGQRPFLHSSPHSRCSCPGNVTWCISSAPGRMLSSATPIPAKLHCLIKSMVIRYQLQRIKVAFPLQCVLPFISLVAFSLHLFFSLSSSLTKSRVSVWMVEVQRKEVVVLIQ